MGEFEDGLDECSYELAVDEGDELGDNEQDIDSMAVETGYAFRTVKTIFDIITSSTE